MPYHVKLDTAGELKLGKLEIGTTRRGIGPCYADKAARLGIRVQDLLDAKILRKKIMAAMEPEAADAAPVRQGPASSTSTRWSRTTSRYGHRLEPYIADTAQLCWEALDADHTVLFEGAQGTMLDLDHGTYPFVTSSNPVAGAACIGAGVGPARHRRGLGHRQGLRDAGWAPVRSRPSSRTTSGAYIRERGGEMGTTTGRPPALRLARPRCPPLRRPAQHHVRARHHEARRPLRDRPAPSLRPLPHPEGARLRRVPLPPVDHPHAPSRSTRSCPGSRATSATAAARQDLPREARDYLDFDLGAPRRPDPLVGVGPGRDQVIWMGEEPSPASAPPRS